MFVETSILLLKQKRILELMSLSYTINSELKTIQSLFDNAESTNQISFLYLRTLEFVKLITVLKYEEAFGLITKHAK